MSRLLVVMAVNTWMQWPLQSSLTPLALTLPCPLLQLFIIVESRCDIDTSCFSNIDSTFWTLRSVLQLQTSGTTVFLFYFSLLSHGYPLTRRYVSNMVTTDGSWNGNLSHQERMKMFRIFWTGISQPTKRFQSCSKWKTSAQLSAIIHSICHPLMCIQAFRDSTRVLFVESTLTLGWPLFPKEQ